MPFVNLPNGVVAHLKVARRPRRVCCAQGCSAWSTRLCDYALSAKRTCNAPMCDAHATSVGPDLDHCPAHAHVQAGLFTGLPK